MTFHSPAVCACDDQSENLLTVPQAMEIAASLVSPVCEVEDVMLGAACGRVAAHPVLASRPMPFFDQSAMDGFAVRLSDLKGEGDWRLHVSETLPAGASSSGNWATNQAKRIYTGAAVPPEADAVVMVEQCSDEGASVVIRRRPAKRENIRPKGNDIAAGALLIAPGTLIEPRHVGLMAANGFSPVGVFRRPRVGVFSTGSELLAQAPEQARIFDANRPMLIALAQAAGAEVADLGVIDDDLETTARFFSLQKKRYDILLSSGGVSAGGRDFVKPAFIQAGGHIRGWKLALKPGKPALFGVLGGAAYFCLPGNPLSAFVGFELFVREQILRTGGARRTAGGEMPAQSGFEMRRKTGRMEYVPARIASFSVGGLPVVEAIGNGSSATLLALGQADGLAVIAADTDRVRVGDRLGFVPFGRPAARKDD